jgi:hypothetical protein
MFKDIVFLISLCLKEEGIKINTYTFVFGDHSTKKTVNRNGQNKRSSCCK